MPEFMHVGSLIVDDIEDKSLKRRGADCAHIKFGEPIASEERGERGGAGGRSTHSTLTPPAPRACAVNAGTAAYFQLERHDLMVEGLLAAAAERHVRLLTFAALQARARRARRSSRASGPHGRCSSSARTGTWRRAACPAIHRLRRAVPAASPRRACALIGGALEARSRPVGRYDESVGTVFQVRARAQEGRGRVAAGTPTPPGLALPLQIMDDVLNLPLPSTRPTRHKRAGVQLKTLGEDITAGKVTGSRLKAIKLLGKAETRALLDVVRMWPRSPRSCSTASMSSRPAARSTVAPTTAINFVKLAFKTLHPRLVLL